ncbi:tRNA (N(6)-L-threonylcarbamoyladenosine(37)-C(2))-methylthiotransferase MtaB [Deferribacterales bacterium Es71-Z0220]|uniref:tRNA (N(6)-L-threonylcarbamoyladenosine(37)-C(2))- methylthiotransferase MtaB n=1 Tax=Deferrivibrio essentukiensis TaxID=2880922 RepID=UPI001F607ABF|nr:tRNA (N(6)-L-threonylcarbamoyladenosine(37)-C(2))-methylthiotransferase MtaB [Deferrivibrio essentukiensis]
MKIYFYTQGCKVNQVETENLKLDAETKNISIVNTIEDSDIVIINSCAVTDNAVKKFKTFIKKTKTKFPDKKIAITGCGADMLKEKGKDLADLVITNSGKADIFEYIIKEKDNFNDIETIEHFEEFNENLVRDKTRGYLKIQDGCDAYCSYCIIPSLRGKPRSRKIESVISAFRSFIANGYKEIVLVGIHIGKYGKDINSSLKDLLKELSEIEGRYRIRLSSLEVNEIDDELIHLILTNNKFCPHFHIPLQSGSDKILTRMNRNYSKNEFIQTVKKIKRINPDAIVGGDVIVGFPGEGETEFEETKQTIFDAGLNYIHVFPYSEREGTKAVTMPDSVPVKIRNERARHLREIAESLKFNFAKKFFGREVEILVEKDNKGLTNNYLEAEILTNEVRNTFIKGKVISVTFDGNLIIQRV